MASVWGVRYRKSPRPHTGSMPAAGMTGWCAAARPPGPHPCEELALPHLCPYLLQACLGGAWLQGPLGPIHVSKIALPDLGIYDNEFIER